MTRQTLRASPPAGNCKMLWRTGPFESPKPQESLKASPPPRKRNPLPESHEAPEAACQALQYWSSVGSSHEGMFGLHFPDSVDRARAVVVRVATQPSVKAGSL